ncbi:tyrosine-type recombinase/integrase [Promicromonospora sp. Populi]|uniref:tyrosine-type recombinase/integrase n=1 Tax=Promicromonospora sp. Populi TaxID=3239420 RepID=UPI0034E1BE37
MGSVEKRTRKNKNGKVTTFYLARWREPGTEKQPSKSFTKKTDAENHVIEMEGDKLRGEYIAANAGKITFRAYTAEWLAARTFDPNTRQHVVSRLDLHVLPVLGDKTLDAIKPLTVQGWLKGLEDKLAGSSRQVIFVHVSSILASAVDDGLIRKNPCKAKSVTVPKAEPKRVIPWESTTVETVKTKIFERYKVVVALGAGLGLRQGEIFGLSLDDFDFKRGMVRVQRQVKVVDGAKYFDLPKYDKVREVPVAQSVREAVELHVKKFRPVLVTLPWKKEGGKEVTANLLVTSQYGIPPAFQSFNGTWKRALRAAKVPDTAANGCHVLRHTYASALLHHGESVKALAEYLGHADPGFTLRTYTHLMKGSDERARAAVDKMFGVTGV